MPILFHSEGVEFLLPKKNKVKSWILNCISSEGHSAGDINFIFCSDHYLLKLNYNFLHHDTYTDIITFDYTAEKKLSGDIFISVDRVSENAVKYKIAFDDELHRVMIHGILHLCGFKDKSSADKLIMRQKEDFYLSLRPF